MKQVSPDANTKVEGWSGSKRVKTIIQLSHSHLSYPKWSKTVSLLGVLGRQEKEMVEVTGYPSSEHEAVCAEPPRKALVDHREL